MTAILPTFSADSTGVITATGWDDPSNICPAGTVSQPIESEWAPEVTAA
jgi:hypothetical protein